MTLPRLASLLTTGALFFARSDQLGDPFEGTFPVKNLDPSYESVMEVVGAHIAHAAGEKERLTKKYLDGVRDLRPKTLINCWYSSSYESAAMWGLYAREEGGVAIRSTVGSLKGALHHGDGSRDVLVGSVRYLDFSAGEIPMTNLLHAFWTKRVSFQHEREVRAILLEQPVDVGIAVEVDLALLLDGIYVSPTASSWMKETVVDLAAKYGIAVEVHQSDLAADPIT